MPCEGVSPLTEIQSPSAHQSSDNDSAPATPTIRYPDWLKALAKSSLAQTLATLVEEFVVGYFILLLETTFHGLSLRAEVSDIFRTILTAVHEGTSLGTYTVVCMRSLLRFSLRKLEL